MELLSYVNGATDVPLLGQTLGQNFDQACERFGSELALVSRHQNLRYTYTELKDQVDRVACSLMRLGFAPGDRLGIVGDRFRTIDVPVLGADPHSSVRHHLDDR